MDTVPLSARVLKSLQASSRKLRDPVDYERGWSADSPVLPENLLVFARHSATFFHLHPSTQHHRFVLLIALQGDGEIRIDRQIHRLRAGRVVLLFPFQMHDYLFFPKPTIHWVYLTFTTRTPEDLEPLRNAVYQATPAMLRALQGVLGEVLPLPPSPSAALKAQLHLALFLKELLSGQSLPVPSEISGSASAVKLLEKVNRYLNAHIETAFDLTDLAHHIGYSESHLRSLFRRAVRMSLGDYISTVRLRKATGLLHAGELTISRIAEACGYNSIFAFSRAFHRAIGCSPTEFRKRIQRPPAPEISRC